jgi:hypothetical protein
MGTMKRLDIRYVAGIIDGEGCISISWDRPGSKISPRFVGQISVGMTNLKLIRLLGKQFGGCIHNYKVQKSYYKPILYWTLTAKAAAKFLNKVLPYLRVKKRQALLLIALHKRKKYTGKKPLSRKEVSIRKRLWQKCWKLNGYNWKKRGEGKRAK